MLFKADENLPIEATELLRQNGHDALSIPEQQMSGQPDVRVAQVCQIEHRALVTLDLDFSDIRAYPPGDYDGIIVLRPSLQTIASLMRLIKQVILLLDREPLAGYLWIVGDAKVRIRGSGVSGMP
jgi:predicted nuclease of predicted toxin-antitoxin system